MRQDMIRLMDGLVSGARHDWVNGWISEWGKT